MCRTSVIRRRHEAMRSAQSYPESPKKDNFDEIPSAGLLDSTLFTFQDHACEETKLRIRCPHGTTINIQWAQYSRLLPSDQICPFAPHRYGKPQENAMSKEKNQCLSSTALQIVLDQCQDRRHCSLLASTTVFGQDPCPNTSKYLEVAYKCRPNEFRSRVVCDGESLQLKCTKSQRLAIYSAKFGWSQHSKWASECSGYSPYSRECDSPCAYGHVYGRCHGRKRCTIFASDTAFDSNCESGTPKYLVVVYTCVPKRILEDIDDENEYPDPCDTTEDRQPSGVNQGDVGVANGNRPGNEEWDYTNPSPDNRPENNDDLEIDGQPSYLPKTTTINYSTALTPQPESKPEQPGNHDNSDVNEGAGEEVPAGSEEYETTGEPNTGAVNDGVAGFVSDWIFTWDFISNNLEKFILYLALGLCLGIICVLLVIIIRLNYLRRRGKREAKLNISEPIANSTVTHNPETTSLLEPSDRSDGVEMTSYNQIGSMHRPPISSFTDPYEEETPVSFSPGPTSPGDGNPHGTFGRSSKPPGSPDTFPDGLPPNNQHSNLYTGSITRNNHSNGGGGTFSGSLTKPNHSRQTSFTGSLGRPMTQPGPLTGSLNRRDHWTNEYRNEGHSHTLQHYYG